MKHIQTIVGPCLRQTLATGGCGECQSSCQSACKTSCTVANQSCASQDARQILDNNENKIHQAFEK